MSNDTEEPSPTAEVLERTYGKLPELGVDQRFMTSIGWRVEAVEHPEDARPLLIPMCILRHFSKRHRYRVTYVRRRF